jgi:uridine kinase
MITITVAGKVASGKTTIAAIIAKALKEQGFHVGYDGMDFENTEEFLEHVHSDLMTHKIEAIKEKSPIVLLNERQIKKGES